MLRSVACRVARPPHRALRVACVPKGRMFALAVRRTPVRPFAGPSGSLAKRGLMTRTNTPEAKRSDQSTEEISKVEAEITEVKEQVAKLEAGKEDYKKKLRAATTPEEKKDYRAMLKDTTAQLKSKNSVLVKLHMPQSTTVPQDGHEVVAMEGLVRMVTEYIDTHMPQATTPEYRVPPVFITSLARSGKTTALQSVYYVLKKLNRCHVILVTFNGDSGFSRRDGESDAEAFLRQTATVLHKKTVGGVPKNMVCSREQLEEYLAKSDKPVVLLVDELNALLPKRKGDVGINDPTKRLSDELSSIIREVFLDKPNRYFVSTSQWYISLSQGESIRQPWFVSIAQTTELKLLQRMMPDVTLNPTEAAIHGFLPGLLYAVIVDGFNPHGTFTTVTRSIQWKDKNLLGDFLHEFIVGTKRLPVDFERFTYRSKDKVAWPLCYAAAFLMRLRLRQDPLPKQLANQIRKTSASTINEQADGKVWEYVMRLAICMVAASARYGLTQLQRRVVGPVPRFDRPLVIIKTIPKQVGSTYDAVFKHLQEQAPRSRERSHPILVVGLSDHPRMEMFDCFTCYLPRDGAEEDAFMRGQQFKEGNDYPSADTPENVTGVLLRGNAPQTAGHSHKKGWDYLTAKEVVEFLPFSLKHLLPSTLPKQ